MGHSASILRPLVSSRTKSLLSFTILIPVPLVLPTVRPPTSYRTAFKTSFKTEVVYLLMKIKKKCHVLSMYSVTISFFDEARLCRLVKISFIIFHGGHKNCSDDEPFYFLFIENTCIHIFIWNTCIFDICRDTGFLCTDDGIISLWHKI